MEETHPSHGMLKLAISSKAEMRLHFSAPPILDHKQLRKPSKRLRQTCHQVSITLPAQPTLFVMSEVLSRRYGTF